MRQFEDFLNALTDMDWGWWPLLSARPAKSKNIDNLVLLKLTALFGTCLGLLWAAFYRLTAPNATLAAVAVRFVLGWFIYFLGYKLTFAYSWNRRATRLRDEHANKQIQVNQPV